MINLDQVRTLEWKVKQAVQLIGHLRQENDTLRSRLSDTEVRLQELETLFESFKATQNEMESGIRSVLAELDHVSDDAPAVEETSPEDLVVHVTVEPIVKPVASSAMETPQATVVDVPESVELEPSAEDVSAFDQAFEESIENSAETGLRSSEEGRAEESSVDVSEGASDEPDDSVHAGAEEEDQPGLGIF